MKLWSGAPASATIFVDQNGVAPYDASTIATADGHNTSFTYPVSTPVTVGEVTVPAGYTATIACGRDPRSPIPAARSRSPLRLPAATLTCTVTNIIVPALDRPRRQALGRGARLGDDLRRPGRSGAVRRVDNRDRRRGQRLVRLCGLDARQRRRDDRSDRLHGDDRLRPGGPAGLHGRPVPGHAPARRGRHAHLHDHEHAADLDRARGQGVGRRARLDDDLRRSERCRAVRRRDGRDRDGDNASFDYPVSTPVTVGERRFRPATRRRSPAARTRPAALHGRPVPGHRSGRRRRHAHLHDHEHAADLDRARRQALGRHA